MISSQAVLKKIYRKVAFSNLIISFGDSWNDNAEILLNISIKYNFLSYCSTWWNELWIETYKTVQNLKPATWRFSAR